MQARTVGNELIRDLDADLESMPKADFKHPPDTNNQVTLGDLHGNQML